MTDYEPPDHFTFFESYYTSFRKLPAKEQHEFYDALFLFVFQGIEPCFENIYLEMAWGLVAPNVSGSIKRSKTNAANRSKKDADNENESRKNDRNNENKNGKNDPSPRKGKEKDKDRDREADKILPTEEESYLAPSSDGAVAASAAPPSEVSLPQCLMDGCDGRMRFDAKLRKFRCGTCQSTYSSEEVAQRENRSKRQACPHCEGDVEETLGGRYVCKLCKTELREPIWVSK